jgi:hypothetical protein
MAGDTFLMAFTAGSQILLMMAFFITGIDVGLGKVRLQRQSMTFMAIRTERDIDLFS